MKKAAVIGNPIEHSRSPLIHNHWLKRGNIEGSYEAIKAEDENDFENVVDRLVKEGYKGFNVTVPFKEKAYQMIDTAIDSVYFPNVSQSVNTVVIEKNKLIGINTDYYGFVEGFAMQHPRNRFNTTHPERFDLNFAFPEIKNVVLLGAGGSARIIAGGLVDVSNFIYEPNCTQ